MVLIDSNIIIYGSKPQYQFVRDYLAKEDIAVSKISLIKTLGFRKLEEEEMQMLKQLLASCYQYSINDEVIHRAIALRQQKKMSLGDAIIAATALQHELLLITANEEDFNWISGLELYNPVV
jgi:predicted nucleic acid-binding protein